MIKHVGKVGPGDPYFCLLLPCHTRLPLRGAVGIGGAEASRRRGASWDPASQPLSAPSRTSGRSLWERASPAERQAPDGHQRARDRGAHGAICSAPRGARPRGRRRECQGPFPTPSPATWSREGSPRRQSGLRRGLALESGSFSPGRGRRPRRGGCGAGHPSFPRHRRRRGDLGALAVGLRLVGSAGSRLLRMRTSSPRLLWESRLHESGNARPCPRSLELFPGLRRVRGLRCFCSKGPGFREGAPEAFFV